MKNKNLYLYICIGVLFVFTIGYFVTINKVSYAFTTDVVQEKYEGICQMIIKSSNIYAENNENLFENKNTIYITVNDLIENKLLSPDENGDILDPRSKIKTLNDLKIRITKKDKKFEVKLLEE